jgi:hypothetical protein
MLSVTVKEVPSAKTPAFTVTDEPSVALVIVPFPVIDQLCVTVPPTGSTVEV